MPRPKRQPHPDLATFAQWRMEAQSVVADHFKDQPPGHPSLVMKVTQAFMDGYIKGRLHQWREEQEIAIFRSSLDQSIN